MATEISNSDDVIDSRDVIKRIDELEDERGDLAMTAEEAQEAVRNAQNDSDSTENVSALAEDLRQATEALEAWDDENGAELKALKALAEEAEGYASDWNHGATMIRDSYFEDYARELAEDIGAIKRDMDWPCNCIDWEKAADELKVDYTPVEFDGVTYWVR